MELVKAEQFGLTQETAENIIKDLPAILAEREPLAEQYKEVITLDIELKETATRAREVRLLIRNNRTKGIENWHKVNKEYFLKGGQFVDAIKRKEIAENERMEEALQEIENYQENKERERIAEIHNKRVAQINQYVETVDNLNFGDMQDDLFEAYLSAKKQAYNERIEAEKKAEAERIAKEKAEAEERERIRIENEKLKKEAEEREKKMESERKEAEKREAELRAKAEAERLAIEKERESERKKQEEILQKERAEAAKLAEQIRLQKETEQKVEAERVEKIEADKKESEKLAKAPVKKQIKKWIDSIQTEIPESIKSEKVANDILLKFQAFKDWAITQAENL